MSKDIWQNRWAKLSKHQLETLGISSYAGEVVLIDYKKNPVTQESFYFNAQEHFPEEELAWMPVFSLYLFIENLDTKNITKRLGGQYEEL